MDKMKRVFSFLLAFVITLGAFSSFGYVALADEVEETKPVEKVATEFLDTVPEDVKSTEYEEAVRRLVAFGIVEGFPDGTFKPENELTRAEFAKMIVIAMNLEKAAEAVENKKTEFGDIYNGHWAQGYINVASSQGLIKGYEDGTFRPSNQVTYAEAVTILVRALGYQDSFLYGKWPNNYISKAAELGISGPVDIPNYDNNALRGNVARLLDETLEKEIIKIVEYEGTAITYQPTDIKLREHTLKIFKDSGRLVGDMYVDAKLKDKQVRAYDGKTDDAILNLDRSSADYREFIGEEVNLFYKNTNKKNEFDVVLLEEIGKADSKFDFVTDAFPEREGVTVELAGHNGRYGLADDAYFYVMEGDTYKKYDGKTKIEAKLAKSLPGRVGKVVVENGEIVYGEIMSDKLVAEDFMVVKEVKEDAIVGISPLRGDHKISFSDKSKYKEVHVFDQNGKKLEVKDIEAGDVVYAQKQYFDKKDSLFIVAVQDNNVTGDLGRTTKDRVEIDGEYENIATHRDGIVARVSMDLLETSDKYTRELASDLHKEDVIAYRGAGNLVVMLSANDELAGYKHGVVTRIWPKDGEIEISVDLDGKGMDRVRFDVQDEDDLYDFKYMNKEGKLVDAKVEDILGQPVAFRLSGEKIAKGSLRLIGKEDKVQVRYNDGTLVFGPSSFYYSTDGKEENTKGFKVTSNAKVIEAYGLNSDFLYEAGSMDNRDDVKAITKASDDFVMYDYEEIANTKFEGKEDFDFGVILNRLGEVETVVIYDKDAEMLKDADAHESIIVTELGKRGDDFDAKYHSYQSGLKTDKGTNIGSKVEAGELALIEINRRGRVSVLAKDSETDFYNGVTEDATVAEVSRNNDTITVGKTDYEIAHDAIVYKNDGRDLEQVEYTEIAKGDTVDFIATKADVIEVLVINTEAKGLEDKDEAKLVKDRLYVVEGFVTRRGVDYVELYDTEAGKSLAPIEYADKAFDTEKDENKVVTVDFKNFDGETVITDFTLAPVTLNFDNADINVVKEEKKHTVEISNFKTEGLAKGHKLVNVKSGEYVVEVKDGKITLEVADLEEIKLKANRVEADGVKVIYADAETGINLKDLVEKVELTTTNANFKLDGENLKGKITVEPTDAKVTIKAFKGDEEVRIDNLKIDAEGNVTGEIRDVEEDETITLTITATKGNFTVVEEANVTIADE